MKIRLLSALKCRRYGWAMGRPPGSDRTQGSKDPLPSARFSPGGLVRFGAMRSGLISAVLGTTPIPACPVDGRRLSLRRSNPRSPNRVGRGVTLFVTHNMLSSSSANAESSVVAWTNA